MNLQALRLSAEVDRAIRGRISRGWGRSADQADSLRLGLARGSEGLYVLTCDTLDNLERRRLGDLGFSACQRSPRPVVPSRARLGLSQVTPSRVMPGSLIARHTGSARLRPVIFDAFAAEPTG